MPVTVTLSNYISLSPRELPAVVVEQLQARLSFPNPAWLENQKRGYSNWQVPETLRCYCIRDECYGRRRARTGPGSMITRTSASASWPTPLGPDRGCIWQKF